MDEIKTREVSLYAPGFIDGVPGEFPGNTVVTIDQYNNVVKVEPMTHLLPADYKEGQELLVPKKAAKKAAPDKDSEVTANA